MLHKFPVAPARLNLFVGERYKRKECAYHYSVIQKSDTSKESERRLALTLYLEGLGFRSIGRILG
ncbi:MAG: hypothetical protein L3J84_00005, partial [Gammaproteobacteria bacterium]|nr:hypothetical protein [Gammaproteobacteria bacterium]